MSKTKKLLQRLFKVPPPKGFTWEELETVLERAGFAGHCSGGSHYMFEHVSGFRFSISKTHPSGLLKTYQIRDVKDALKCVGVTGDQDG